MISRLDKEASEEIYLKDTIGIGGWEQIENDIWEYDKRRSMQEILPGIFLGPYSAASKSQLHSLKMKGITHIICVRSIQEGPFIKPNFSGHFRYMVLDIQDSANENIVKYFKQVNNFVEEALKCGGQILIHGNAGVSRSATLVIAFIMDKYTPKLRAAYEFLQQKRHCIRPNDGFIAQLNEYEAICEAKRQNIQEPSTKRGIKRGIDEVYEHTY